MQPMETGFWLFRCRNAKRASRAPKLTFSSIPWQQRTVNGYAMRVVRFIPQRPPNTRRSTNGKRLEIGIHYPLRSSLMMKTGPVGEAGSRRRRAVEVLSGPDRWNRQRTGLAGWPLRQRPNGYGGSRGLRFTFWGIRAVTLLQVRSICPVYPYRSTDAKAFCPLLLHQG